MHTIPKSAAELLQAMVRFDTVTRSVSGRAEPERVLGDWLVGLAQRWGLETRDLPVDGNAPNRLIQAEIDPGLPWLMLDSHLDTVGVAGMTIDPFGGEVRDDRIWGRGAADTKGTGAAMLWALHQAHREGSLVWNVGLLFSIGEEHMQPGARSFLEHDLPSLDWAPCGVVVGEPTSMKVVAATNGYVRARLVTHGLAAHSSTPHLGRNAVLAMARVLLSLESELATLPVLAHPLTGPGTASVNLISGGTQINVVPERCEARLDLRITPHQTPEGAIAQLETLLRRLQNTDPTLRVELTAAETAPPLDHTTNQTLATWASGTLQAAGIPAPVVGGPYTTNANRYAQQGLPCVVLGPGEMSQAHTAEESIALEELETGVRGYGALLKSGALTETGAR